jgi:HD-GYP domain-containing protein (c-di-GMP phosphodiesterase class II)
LEEAIEELVTRRGTYYDPAVVDVCVSLLKKKGFTF